MNLSDSGNHRGRALHEPPLPQSQRCLSKQHHTCEPAAVCVARNPRL